MDGLMNCKAALDFEVARASAAQNPIVITVMGLSGVGKSTLINALFGTSLIVSHSVPCTQEAQKVIFKPKNGVEIWIWDLPGFDSSCQKGRCCLTGYQRKFIESDAVLWVVQAQTTSLVSDKHYFDQLVQGIDKRHWPYLLNKITFVLTKADCIAAKPWQEINRMGCKSLIPHPKTLAILELEAEICKMGMLSPYAELWKKSLVHQQCIPCSSNYRFNLQNLLSITFQKIRQNSETATSSFRLVEFG